MSSRYYVGDYPPQPQQPCPCCGRCPVCGAYRPTLTPTIGWGTTTTHPGPGYVNTIPGATPVVYGVSTPSTASDATPKKA